MSYNQSAFNRIITMTKRESWENKKTIIYSLLGTVVLIFLFSLWGNINAHEHIKHVDTSMLKKDNSLMTFMMYMINIPVLIIMWVVICLYLVHCLYNDRKDQSILFWQSLPITQTETVISKILWACLIIPFITLVFMLFNALLVSLISTVVYHTPGLNWSLGSLFTALKNLSLVYIFQLMIFLPALGWCLFCSAFSKKLPLLWALLVPFGIQICDAIANHGYINEHVFKPIYLAIAKLNFLAGYINLPQKAKDSAMNHLCHSQGACDLSLYHTISFKSTGLSPTFVLVSAVICIVLIIASIKIRSRSFGNDH